MQPITNLLVNGVSSVSVGGTGVAQKVFPSVPGSSINVASTSNGYIYCPGSGRANGQHLVVMASGNYTLGGAPSPTFTLALLEVDGPITQKPSSSATLNTLASVTEAAGSETFATLPWALRANLYADSDSGVLQGDYAIQIYDGAVQSGAITSRTGLNMSNDIPFALAIGVTFSASFASNSAKMFSFLLEQ